MSTVPSRTKRIEVRLLPHQKSRIERAASIRRLSVSDFIVQTADDAAVRTISEHGTWVLTQRDSTAFVKALLAPPAPNERLRREMERFVTLKRGVTM